VNYDRANAHSAWREPLTIEGELVAKFTGTSPFSVGDRVFHIKFGNSSITRHRRQQADHPVGQGGREARGGSFCGEGRLRINNP